MTVKFDPTKPVRTREGREARVICINAKQSEHPIVALFTDRNGIEYPAFRTKNGRVYDNCIMPGDLVNVPITHTKWVNFYKGDIVFVRCYDSREDAIQASKFCYKHCELIACIPLIFREGEGVREDDSTHSCS